MKDKILSTQQCGKTLESWYDYIEQIKDMKVDNYVLYINKDFYNMYKDKLNFIDCEMEITTNLPKNVNAVYMKKCNLEYMGWFDE